MKFTFLKRLQFKKLSTKTFSSRTVNPPVARNEIERIAEEQFFAQHRPLMMGGMMQSIHVTNYNNGTQPLKDLSHRFSEKSFGDSIYSMPQYLAPKVSLSLIDALMAPTHPSLIRKPSMHLINILKRRRKKMNKHKWKKYRREVRNSTRYNPEKTRKKKKLKRRGLIM
jgi:hypothetical protein